MHWLVICTLPTIVIQIPSFKVFCPVINNSHKLSYLIRMLPGLIFRLMKSGVPCGSSSFMTIILCVLELRCPFHLPGMETPAHARDVYDRNEDDKRCRAV